MQGLGAHAAGTGEGAGHGSSAGIPVKHDNRPIIAASRGFGGADGLVRTGRETHVNPLNIVVVRPDQIVTVHCDGVASDNDDTAVLHTGRFVHDGHDARFALALSRLLMEVDQRNGYTVLSQDERTLGISTGSVFNAASWQPFEECTGRSELAVIADIVGVANDRFRLAARGLSLSADALQAVMSDVMDSNFEKFMRHVRVDEGLFDVFRQLNGFGVPVGMCSASSEAIVKRMLMTKGVFDVFSRDAFVCGAVKRNDSGFSGEDVRRTCAALGVAPQRCVMFGDTMNDVGAAKLAGIPVTVIRPGAALSNTDLSAPSALGNYFSDMKAAGESFVGQERYRNELLSRQYPHPHALLIVSDFKQVRARKLEAPDGYAKFVIS